MPAVRGTTEAVSSVKDQLTGQLHRVRQQKLMFGFLVLKIQTNLL